LLDRKESWGLLGHKGACPSIEREFIVPFEYQYITTPDERDEAIAALSRVNEIAVDIEGDSLYHYNERVALIQISGGGRNYVFDPFLLDSVLGLGPLFENRAILKIFHGSDYDITSLKRDYGFKIGPVFDTALAARAIGMVRYSLKELVFRFFQVTLSKEHQKSDWSMRPLSKEQLDYAAEDTVYLSSLRLLLIEEVSKNGRMDQLLEEFQMMENLSWTRKPFDPGDYIRIKGANALPFEGQQILRALVAVRDRLAREKDLPPFKVAHSGDLVRLAVERPLDETAFMEIFPKGRITRDKTLWLEAIARGVTATEPLSKKERKSGGGPPMTRYQQKLFINLRSWRDKQAETEGVEPAMVLTTPALAEVAKKRPSTIEVLKAIPILRKWQIAHYGEQLVKEVTSFVPAG
jgi:ribonuclease D